MKVMMVIIVVITIAVNRITWLMLRQMKTV